MLGNHYHSRIEVYAVVIEAQSMINLTGTISSGELKGVTANRNITAFSIAIKIPFFTFFVLRDKKEIYTKLCLQY